MNEIREVGGMTPDRFRTEIIPAARPVVLRGFAADWPAVRASDGAGYLHALAADHRCEALIGPPEIRGRFFYSPGLTGFNFKREPTSAISFLDRLTALADTPNPIALAVQSLPAPEMFPGFAEANINPLLGSAVSPRLWIGNRVVTALHHDVMHNIAIVVSGQRRFTLIPPEQTPNLYMGPFEFTPAGTPVSLADPEAPDLDRFPRFAAALEQADTAELVPGDAIYIPYMWWHQVRSLDPVSVLANYWWNETSAAPGLAPIDALVHALLALRTIPEPEREAWHAMFEAVLFSPDLGHIPPVRQGIMGEIPPQVRDALRRQLGAVMAKA